MVNYGLIGRRLGHSFSASYFAQKFDRENIDAHYSLFPIDNEEDIVGLISSISNLRGLNVTVPYKKSILAVLGDIELTPEARSVSAVNTLCIETLEKNGKVKITGHNTDIEGFRESLHPLLEGRADIRRALILGATGGAASAVRFVLNNQLGIHCTPVSRSGVSHLRYEEVSDEIIRTHKLIVNCTPLGMWPDINSAPDIPYSALTTAHIGYDLIYNPETTLFMKKFIALGATVCSGLDMLRLQAEASYKFWTKQ